MIALQNNQRTPKYCWLFFSLILIIIAWAANPWQLYFFNDDYMDIPLAISGQTGLHNSLRHVNDLSFYLDSIVWNGKVAGFHITNLLLHIANMVMGIFLLQKIGSSFQVQLSQIVSVIIVSLFGVYAFHSEALFWIISRTASLSFFFTMLCWLCLMKSSEKRIWLLPTGLFFLLGIFTYEAIWVFPVWLVLWYFLLPRQSLYRSRLIIPIALIWVLFIAYFPIRLAVTSELLGSYEAGDVQQVRILPMVEKTVKLFARSFLPPVYSHKLFVVLVAILFIGLTVWGVFLLKRVKANRLLLFFLAAWLVSYFPYVSLGISTSGYQSERYLYFPSFFLCAFLVYGGLLAWQGSTKKQVLFVAALFAYHLFFFIESAQVFKKVSSYSANAIKAMQQVPLSKKIIIRQLPAFSYGIPVFNYGFGGAIRWQMPNRDTGSVQVLSTHNFEKEEIQIRKIESSPVNDTLLFYDK